MIGKTIAHYRIVEKIGEGGMGVVYKAEDTHLDRFVVLKMLPADKVSRGERKRRFVQEAKAASALNHPNIVHVYDIAEADGVDYIAMEYVPGKTLDRVIPRGGLPVSDVLAYSVQIADALSTAHAAGIIHRDLKPSNLILGDDGRVRVLDFGLAKLTDPEDVSEDEVTRTVALEDDQLTEAGTILGTSSYMSPEQAEGKVVDRRSDIFSFGVVLYEMVTGRRAFRGDTSMSTLALIINQEPSPVSEVADDVPGELERIINRCLRKNSGRRFQHMEDLCVALLELKEESDSGTLGVARAAAAAPRKRARWWPVAVAGAALLGIAGGWLVRTGSETATEGTLRESGNSIPVPVPFTTYAGEERNPDFSPDGDRVVFTWDGESGENQDVYIKLIGEATAQRLTVDPAPDTNPKWSPDGRLIAFVRHGDEAAELIVVPSIGGPDRVLLTFSERGFSEMRRLAWWPDSKHLAVADRREPGGAFGLYRVSIDTRDMQQLTFPPESRIKDLSPAVSPDGRQLAFHRVYGAREGSVLVQGLTEAYEPAGEPRKLSGDEYASSPAWSADGTEIIFTSGLPNERPELRRVPGRGGESESIGYAVGGSEAAVSSAGERMVYVLRVADDDIWQGDLTGHSEPQPLIRSTYRDLTPHFSPDVQRIAFSSNRSGYREISVCDSDGGNAIQLTHLESIQSSGPNWSPDGEEIAFQSTVENQREIFVVSANGGKPRQLTDHPAVDAEPTWSRDGAWVYFGSDRGGTRRLWKVPREGGEPVMVTDGSHALESHDGQDLYFFNGGTTASGVSVWKLPVRGGPAVKVIDLVHGQPQNTAITPDGLLYLKPRPEPDGNWWLWRYDFASGNEERVKPLPGQAGIGLAASPDGKTVLFTIRSRPTSDLMLVENFR